MSDSACLVFYGIRIAVKADEIEGLEARSDARLIRARKAGLKHYWGQFGTLEQTVFLFIGYELGRVGLEGDSEMILSAVQLEEIRKATDARLKVAELDGDPQLYLEWQADN